MSTDRDENAIHRAAFRDARRRGDPLAAARAAAQLRADSSDLDPRDLQVLRRSRLTIGRAIRDARSRRLQPRGATMPPVPARRRMRFPFALAATIVLAAVVLTALYLQLPNEIDGGRAAPRAAVPSASALPTAALSRGRVVLAVRAVVPVLEQPQPQPAPTITPVATLDPNSDAFPTDGQSVVPGTGTGSGPGFASCPAFVPGGFARLCGQVVDASTGRPIADACVSLGPCSSEGVHTDPNGRWAVLLPVGDGKLTWFLEFSKAGYAVSKYTQTSRSGRILIPTQQLGLSR
jgi:hypothetical protein